MKKIIYIVPVLALMLFSCNEYLDVNDDPNTVNINEVPPRLLLPGAQLNAYKVQDSDAKRLGSVFMNSWAGNVYSFTGGFASEYNLTISNTFYDEIFEDTYLALANFQKIIQYDNANGSQDNYIAIAKIMKAYYMQNIVDLYGDVPYSEAFQLVENLSPAYDDDADVYSALFTELEEAEALISGGLGDAVGGEDIVLDGNMPAWSNFAKIVKLKLLMRMSSSTNPDAVALSALIAPTLAGETFMTNDITINPGFNGGRDDQMNPFVLEYRINSAGQAPTNYNFVRPSKHLADFLNGAGTLIPGTNPNSRTYPGFSDPRRGRLWTGAAGGVIGNEQGETSSDPTTFPGAQPFGILNFWPHYNGDPITIANLASVDGYVITKQEIEFLLAETSLVYPSIVPTGNGGTHFNNAVEASFDYLFIAPGYPSYAANISSVAGLGWTGSDNDKLEAIMTQKWLGLQNINPIENYIDYTRTGFPATPLATSTSKPNKPKRLIYPDTEYIANAANVPNVTEADVFVVNSLSPFWLQP